MTQAKAEKLGAELAEQIRVARDDVADAIAAAQVPRHSECDMNFVVRPMAGDARAWALCRTKLDEALMWAERAMDGGP